MADGLALTGKRHLSDNGLDQRRLSKEDDTLDSTRLNLQMAMRIIHKSPRTRARVYVLVCVCVLMCVSLCVSER